MQAERLNTLIAQIYAAAIDRELMPEMFVQLVAYLDASAGAFMLVRSEDNSPEIELLFNHLPEAQKLYQEHYAAMDGPTQYVARNPGLVVISESLFERNPSTYVRVYEEDFSRKYNCQHRMGIGINIDNRITGVIGVHREASKGSFHNEQAAAQLFKLLYPHFCQAFRISTRIAHSEAILRSLYKLKTAVAQQLILYSVDGDLLFADDSLADWLSDFSSILWRDEQLQFMSARDRHRFKSQLAAGIAAGGGLSLFPGDSFELTSDCGGKMLRVEVSPGYARGVAKEVAAVVTLTIKEAHILCADTVRKRFGLTSAEFFVAKALVEGFSAKEYAEKNSVSVATVRTQIRAIFDKVGVKRQTDLVRLLLG